MTGRIQVEEALSPCQRKAAGHIRWRNSQRIRGAALRPIPILDDVANDARELCLHESPGRIGYCQILCFSEVHGE